MTTETKRFALLLALSLLIGGCADILSATRSGPIEDDPGKRSFGRYVDDEIIETKALVNIRHADPALDDARVLVTSFNGVILLTGQVQDNRLRALAAEVAATVKGVRKVHNELEIDGRTAILVRGSDSWITTKVKATLVADETVKSSRIKVTTENSVVYLMGIVSNEQAERAATLASRVNGVKRVVRVFEYL